MKKYIGEVDGSTEKLIRNLLSDISWLEQGSSYERDICKNIYKALAIIEPNKKKLNGLISEYHLDERLQAENEKDQQTEKLEANIIENGRCIICGKPLEGNRLFVCEDCSKKMETEK